MQRFPLFRRPALAATLLAGASLAASGAHAVYRHHPVCDPDIESFDAAVVGDPALGALATRVDDGWRRLAAFGDPDMRAATRDRRLNWLCEIKQQCGANVFSGRECIADALRRRERLTQDLLRQRDAGDQRPLSGH